MTYLKLNEQTFLHFHIHSPDTDNIIEGLDINDVGLMIKNSLNDNSSYF